MPVIQWFHQHTMKYFTSELGFQYTHEPLGFCFRNSWRSTYYENHRTVEWVRIFVQRPLPLSFADLPTFLRVVVSLLQAKFKLKVGKRKEADIRVNKNQFYLLLTHLSAFFPFPTFSLNFAYSQLTTTRRNVGGSAKESGSGRCTKIRAHSTVR